MKTTETTKRTKRGKTVGELAKATKAKASKAPKTASLFLGKVTASRVLNRSMKEFKKCRATCWMLISESEGVYRFANSYNGPTPKSSWNPKDYEFRLTGKARKQIEKKIEQQGFTEIEPTDWPEWITSAKPSKRTRK